MKKEKKDKMAERRLHRSEPVRVSSFSERHSLRGHALFVRFLERRGVADCVHYFPEDMTLGLFRKTTPRELMLHYNVTDPRDRERLLRIAEHAKRDYEHSDSELVCRFFYLL